MEPTNHIVKTYGAGAPVSPLTGPDGTTNAPVSYSKVLTGKATGYYSKTGKGSSGLGLGYGTVAVDPDVIPYGPTLYITSTDGKFVYGDAVATDTGMAVQKGQILSLIHIYIERERGITIKARAVTMNYTAKDGKTCLLYTSRCV